MHHDNEKRRHSALKQLSPY
ncbi:hypothetical protein [Hymenobacter cheonanensis]